jgi:hypothetical protein
MEYIAYSSMFVAYEEANGQAKKFDYEVPKFDLGWKKSLKSSAWLSLVGLWCFLALLLKYQPHSVLMSELTAVVSMSV